MCFLLYTSTLNELSFDRKYEFDKLLLNMNRILALLITIIWGFVGNAQSISPKIVASVGKTQQGLSMQIDWTLGEIAITAIQNPSVMVTQGFHQPAYLITSINTLPTALGQIKVFPNPTSDWIEMNLKFQKIRTVQIKLVDVRGRLIWSKTQNGLQFLEQVNMHNFPNGNYFLSFSIDDFQFLQTYKVQKLD